MAASQTCPLAYPEKFSAAVTFVTTLAKDSDLSEEGKLLLYALNQQATVGPCNEPRPWGWNVVSNAKWQSWKQLADMANMEAMRLYVRTLEEEIPDWWGPEVAAAMEAAATAPQENGNGAAAEEVEKEEENTPESEPALAPAEAPVTEDPPAEPAAHVAPSAAPIHASKSTVNAVSTVKNRSVAEVVVEGSWVSPYIASDRRPPPRYEQAMALLDSQLYIVGGNCGGRYLGDTWVLNLDNLTWRCVSAGTKAAKQTPVKGEAAAGDGEEAAALLAAPALPPLAGHAAVPWNGNVVALGGHTKSKDEAEMPVRLLDTQAGVWSALAPSLAEGVAAPPRPRGGHSATVIGSKAYVFGGEDAKRKPLDELWTLDLTTLEWAAPQTAGTAPAPRSAHSACAYRNRYIIVFGGGSVANCFDDLAVFDTQTLEWSAPEVEGRPPQRAGHAAAVLGSTLYVVGGGNNTRGCADMYALDLSTLADSSEVLRWTLVGNTPAESAIAAEGLSLLCVPSAECMVSFGGYNGLYHNAVHVYRPEIAAAVPSKPAVPQEAALAVAPAAEEAAPAAAPAIEATPQAEAAAGAAQSPRSDADSARREAAAAKEAAALEVSIMRRQLDSAATALAAAERAAEEAKEALAEETQRAVALEVEVAELRQKLVAMGEMERELTRYRARAEEESNKKTGLWGFITGADTAASPTGNE